MARQVTFSAHAREQIRERDLSEEMVTQVIENPDQVATRGGRQIAQRRVHHGGKAHLLRVVYEEVDDQVMIVTAYRTSRVSKYWRQE